jgi:hypothetical protein
MRKGILVPLAAAIFAATPALAQIECMVTDPTGTPLNVREFPNGPILGALHNGVIVQRFESQRDDRGRVWTYVVPEGGGKAGWVFREFVSCR